MSNIPCKPEVVKQLLVEFANLNNEDTNHDGWMQLGAKFEKDPRYISDTRPKPINFGTNLYKTFGKAQKAIDNEADTSKEKAFKLRKVFIDRIAEFLGFQDYKAYEVEKYFDEPKPISHSSKIPFQPHLAKWEPSGEKEQACKAILPNETEEMFPVEVGTYLGLNRRSFFALVTSQINTPIFNHLIYSEERLNTAIQQTRNTDVPVRAWLELRESFNFEFPRSWDHLLSQFKHSRALDYIKSQQFPRLDGIQPGLYLCIQQKLFPIQSEDTAAALIRLLLDFMGWFNEVINTYFKSTYPAIVIQLVGFYPKQIELIQQATVEKRKLWSSLSTYFEERHQLKIIQEVKQQQEEGDLELLMLEQSPEGYSEEVLPWHTWIIGASKRKAQFLTNYANLRLVIRKSNIDPKRKIDDNDLASPKLVAASFIKSLEQHGCDITSCSLDFLLLTNDFLPYKVKPLIEEFARYPGKEVQLIPYEFIFRHEHYHFLRLWMRAFDGEPDDLTGLNSSRVQELLLYGLAELIHINRTGTDEKPNRFIEKFLEHKKHIGDEDWKEKYKAARTGSKFDAIEFHEDDAQMNGILDILDDRMIASAPDHFKTNHAYWKALLSMRLDEDLITYHLSIEQPFLREILGLMTLKELKANKPLQKFTCECRRIKTKQL